MADCQKCLDGFVMVKVPDKRDPARMRDVAVRCECFYVKRRASLLKAARLPERYDHCTFEDFDYEFPGATRSLVAARLAAGKFIEGYPLEKTGLLFVGPVGVGKTHLACSIVRKLTGEKGIPALFFSYADLLTAIRDTYNAAGERKGSTDEYGNFYETESQILDHVTGVELLLLDEVGKVKASEWTIDKIREIIGGRYNKARTIIATTNFPIEGGKNEITLEQKIGADMVSRLLEMCHVVKMDGVDFRKAVMNADYR
jgi:DNA replication protein DnaC